MVCVKDVNQSDFVTAFAAFLKKQGKLEVPKWSEYAKTNTCKVMGPANDDWFYVRTAAIGRQLYIKGRLGVGQLSKMYSAAANKGMHQTDTKKVMDILHDLHSKNLKR